MVRKRLIIILCLFLAVPSKDSVLVMFWNLENYFDWKDDAPGIRNWTKRKFQRKSLAIAKTIFWISDVEGRLPDVIGLAEVENRFVLERLLRDTPLHRAGYGIVHYDSPDPRGIDVALLYRKETLTLLEAKPLRVGGEEFRTRDILLAKFQRESSDSLVFLVNHHPSKYGGSTGERRKAALDRLKDVTDSLLAEGNKDIIAMGDFNDTPESTKEYSTIMVNLALPLAKRGEGTIKYSGKWELIDMFFISQRVASRNPGVAMKVVKAPFLTVKDNAHSGEKPLRTYTGPGYAGGVSDHCPITLVIQ
jgi:exonuclease III